MFPFPNILNAGGGRAQFTTWNPADADSHISLSNGNLTATASITNSAVRGTTSKSSGKWGLTWTYIGGQSCFPGVANATQSLSTSPTSGANSLTYFPSSPVLRQGATVLRTGLAVASGSSVVDLLLDLTNLLAWLRVDGGLWNNNGTADPSAGVDGISFSSMGAVFPFFDEQSSPVAVTLNPFAVGYPAGFKAWDAF